MKRSSISTFLLTAALALGTTLQTATPARATGLLVARFGGEWGHPMSDDLWAIYYNPAGLSLLEGTKLVLAGSFAWRTMTYTRDPAAIDDILSDPNVGAGTPDGSGVAANSGQASLTNFLQTPFFALGTDFGVKGFGAAIGLYVPIGGQTIFDKSATSGEFPGAVDGPQRWWTIEGTIRSIYATAALAYRIEPWRLSIGVGFNGVLSEIDNVQARNVDGTDNLVANGRLLEGRARIDVSSIDLSLGLGLLFEPIDNLFIGASYQSQPNFGQQTLTGDVDLILGGGPAPENTSTAAEVTQAMPDVVRFGVRYGEPGCWEVRAFADWARWSVLKEQCILNASIDGRTCEGATPPGKIIIIPRDWKDAWGVRGGGSWWASHDVELVVGGGFDGTSVPDNRLEAALYDGEKYHLTLGAKFTLGGERRATAGPREGSFELMVQFTQFYYPDRDIAARGRVAQDPNNTGPNAPTITDISAIDLRPAARVPDGAGLYEHGVSLLELGASYRF